MVLMFLVALAALPDLAVSKDKDLVQYRDFMEVDRIIGGVPATIEEFPFIVALIYTVKNDSFSLTRHGCGGSILTKDWVLTAAHCVEPALPTGWVLEQLFVRAGSSHHDRGGVMRRVTETVSHDFPPHDIGLIKVNEPLPLDGITISLARLPRQGDPTPVGSPATLMGWGDKDVRGTSPDILMKHEVVVTSYLFCLITWIWEYNYSFILDNCICTLFRPEKTPSYAYLGDSGSPVVVGGEVIGITSKSIIFYGFPDLGTRVSPYIDWIEEHVGPLPRDK